MVCDLWLVDFDPFHVSALVACERNYDWRQWKTQLWTRLLSFRVCMFIKSAVSKWQTVVSVTIFCFCLSPVQRGNHSTEGQPVEPWYNEPLYNEVLVTANDILRPSNSKIYGKEPPFNETSLRQTYFASPLAFFISSFYCISTLRTDKKWFVSYLKRGQMPLIVLRVLS